MKSLMAMASMGIRVERKRPVMTAPLKSAIAITGVKFGGWGRNLETVRAAIRVSAKIRWCFLRKFISFWNVFAKIVKEIEF
jgi:hypothetical protein